MRCLCMINGEDATPEIQNVFELSIMVQLLTLLCVLSPPLCVCGLLKVRVSEHHHSLPSPVFEHLHFHCGQQKQRYSLCSLFHGNVQKRNVNVQYDLVCKSIVCRDSVSVPQNMTQNVISLPVLVENEPFVNLSLYAMWI
jgi:hypothetical protein